MVLPRTPRPGARHLKRVTSDEITILTPLYLNCVERWNYFMQTMESFYRCNLFPLPVRHHVVDDRSPEYREEIEAYCRWRGLTLVARIDGERRRGYFDTFATLVNSVETPYFLYLEPDHYFYLPCDFLSPVLRLFRRVPQLYQVYLRAPLYYEGFKRADENTLVTSDGSVMQRVPLDPENTGWVGVGHTHESFSFMPSVFSTALLRTYLAGRYLEGTPAEVEWRLAKEWEGRCPVGYLNGQAFCYHIGAAGKSGFGGYLVPPDRRYEAVWSVKHL